MLTAVDASIRPIPRRDASVTKRTARTTIHATASGATTHPLSSAPTMVHSLRLLAPASQEHPTRPTIDMRFLHAEIPRESTRHFSGLLRGRVPFSLSAGRVFRRLRAHVQLIV